MRNTVIMAFMAVFGAASTLAAALAISDAANGISPACAVIAAIIFGISFLVFYRWYRTVVSATAVKIETPIEVPIEVPLDKVDVTAIKRANELELWASEPLSETTHASPETWRSNWDSHPFFSDSCEVGSSEWIEMIVACDRMRGGGMKVYVPEKEA